MAVKRVVLLVLKSPRFLFRETGTTPYDIASRLSFGLWDSIPDAALLQAAADGKLATREQVTAHAERMAGDLRTRAKVADFFHQWLRVDQIADVSKDPEAFPGFDDAVAADLRTSLDLFLDDVIWSERSDFRDLLLADYVYMNGRLTKPTAATSRPMRPFRKVVSPTRAIARACSAPVPDGGIRAATGQARPFTAGCSSSGASWDARCARRPKRLRRSRPAFTRGSRRGSA